MKPLHKLLSILLALIIIVNLLTVIPFSADTVDDITYIDENGDVQTLDEVTELTTDSGILRDGWYAVNSDIEFDSRMNAAGDVHIILCNGCTLTAHKGITVAKTRNITNSLTVYAQSTDVETMGAIVIDDVSQNNAGIGNTSSVYGHGNITVNGGKVTVSGGEYGAGIGGGNGTYSTGVVINGGIVSANGGRNAAGVGGGSGAGCDVVINGGTVNATGGLYSAGVGSGYLSSTAAAVKVTGGTVNANGNSGGAGIGSGRIGSGSNYALDSDCDIEISGGNVTAVGVNGGAGIGGGTNSKGNVEITGGTIHATAMNTGGGATVGAGIGNGYNTSGAAVTLSWTSVDSDNYYADKYSGTVTLQKFFTDRQNEIYTTGTVADNDMIGDKIIYPCEPKVKKIWEIGSNRTLRPDSISIVLQIYKSPRSGQPEEWTTDVTVTLNSDNNWETDFSDYTSADGKSYRARVRELDAENHPVYKQGDPEYQEDEDDEDKRPVVVYPVNSEGRRYKLNYRVTYETDSSGKLTVTNEIDERTLKVEKEWDIDLENLDRPDSIQVMAQAKDGNSWKNIQIVTLDKDNEWKAELCVPKYRYEGDTKKELDYRIRELKEESLYNQFMSGIKDLVVQGKSTYDEWTNKLKTEGQNAYYALPEDVRKAMDESYESLCETLGVADDKVNELYDKLMDILERESAGIRVVRDEDDDDKGEKEETNAVVYNVPEYESVVAGGTVEAHATKYKVTYDEGGDDVTVTNLAIQEIDLYKHWIMLGDEDDEDKPDSAWLVLMCKPKTDGAVDNAKNLAEMAGLDTDFSDLLDYEFPVINPIEGGNNPISIISQLAIDDDDFDLGSIVEAALDFFGLEDLIPKLAIMKVTEDDKWTAKVVDKKYTCGIQMEYRGAELSGEIIRQIIKYITDGVIDLPISYNPFDNYVTVSTKAIPKLRWMSLDDFDWSDVIAKGKSVSQEDLDNLKPQDLIFDKTALMTHIINVKYKSDDDNDDDEPTEPTEPTEPESGKLTITAHRPAAGKAKEQSFIYNVSGPENTSLTVAIVLNAGETSGSVTIAKLPAGSYTVAEEKKWSWRYSNGDSKNATVSTGTAEVSFDHTEDRLEWLNGYSHRYFE